MSEQPQQILRAPESIPASLRIYCSNIKKPKEVSLFYLSRIYGGTPNMIGDAIQMSRVEVEIPVPINTACPSCKKKLNNHVFSVYLPAPKK